MVKMDNKLEFFRNLLVRNIKHRFQTQIEQYIASHESNEVNNTPKKIEARLKKFYPEMKELFNQNEE